MHARTSCQGFAEAIPFRCLFALVLVLVSGSLQAAPPLTAEQTKDSLHKAVTFFRQEVSTAGGYLWKYSADLATREGEGKAGPQTAWVQPPGTPSVGEALLTAHARTGDAYLLEAAKETAMALVQGQLHSGGWDYRIEFDPKSRSRYAYRVEGPAGKKRNVTTLDDNTTQAALRLLMHVDRVLDFEDKDIHESVMYSLERLMAVQYPNGAWPQRFTEPADPDDHPVSAANYPDTWRRTYPGVDYRSFYTFNDNTIADTISTMFLAADVYKDDRYRQSAERAGDFILLAQMPEPQPAWSQQYNAAMQPAWARKFEPAAVTGGESQNVLRTLMLVYRHTGDQKYLEPIPRALAYLQKSRLPDGQLARFYELKTNRPLYFTMDYQLTYSSDDMPTHYAFIVGSKLDNIAAAYDQLREQTWQPPKVVTTPPRYRLTSDLQTRAQAVVDSLDARGAWVEAGSLRYQGDDDSTTRIIDTRTFASNIDLLSRFLAASQ